MSYRYAGLVFICMTHMFALGGLEQLDSKTEGCQSEASMDLSAIDYQNESWSKSIAEFAFGKTIGVNQGYIGLGIIAAKAIQENAQLFGDARAFYYYNNHWSGSLGMGYRFSCSEVSNESYAIWGINAYYDCLEAKYAHYDRKNFQRLGLGVEYLSSCLDFRFNGYMPVGKSYQRGGRRNHRSMLSLPWGGDGEVGMDFPICADAIYAYFGLGGYYFKFRDSCGVSGVQARVEISWQEFISAQFLYTYDHKFASKYQGKIVLNIPLDVIIRCFFPESGDLYNDEFSPWKDLVKRKYTPFVH